MHPGNDNKKPEGSPGKVGSSDIRRRRSQGSRTRKPGTPGTRSQGQAKWNRKRPSTRRPAPDAPRGNVRTQQTSAAEARVAPKSPVISRPEKNCDIIMNGGLAGAFVYPAASVELAKTYRFKRIGGSSLGSVSAALTAAAEIGRGRENAGFEELSKILEWMKEGSQANLNLYDLLVPEKGTSKYFNALKKLKGKSKLTDLIAAGRASMGHFPLVSLLALIPALAAGAGAFFSSNMIVMGVMIALALALALTLPPFAAVIKLVSSARKALFRNGFGLCTGKTAKGKGKSLISWLSDSLNKLAAKEGDKPLLFKDLWVCPEGEDGRNVELQFMAADISLGQPLRLPEEVAKVEEPEDIYYFREEDMQRCFPAEVVASLMEDSRKSKYFNKVKGFMPLPEPGDLPVVFALRLSMSIPFIMSSIPLYRVNRIRQKGRVRWQMSKSWISGAGLAGNFHVHSFDRPLPVWPTFGIHVAPVGGESEGYGDKKKGIWVQNLINQQGPSLWLGFNHFQSFLKAAFNVTGIYEDRLLLQTPGFKERMAVVKIAQSQSGLFAELDKETCDHLVNLGENAARQLAERYTKERSTSNSTSWDAHRWIRYRNAMAMFEKKLIEFKATYNDVHEDEDTYDHLIMRSAEVPPDAYRWSDTGQRNHALRVTNQLLDFISRWQQDQRTFSSGDMPSPEPEMRIEPRR